MEISSLFCRKTPLFAYLTSASYRRILPGTGLLSQHPQTLPAPTKMLPSPQANGTLENGWLARLKGASWRWNNRLTVAVIALCTPSVSQMAYPTENVMCPCCTVLQLPEPKWKTVTYMSTPTLLHAPFLWILQLYLRHQTLRPPFLQFRRWLRCWLALTGCSSDFQKWLLPISSKKQESRNGPSDLARLCISASLEPRWRPWGARFRCSFLISSNGCIQFCRAQASSIQSPPPYVSLPPSSLHPFLHFITYLCNFSFIFYKWFHTSWLSAMGINRFTRTWAKHQWLDYPKCDSKIPMGPGGGSWKRNLKSGSV